MSRKLKVKTLDGRSMTLQVDPEISVPVLKELLQKEAGIPKTTSRIISNAQVFKDDKKLSDYITKDNETIHVINKPTVIPDQTPPPPTGPAPAPQPGAAQPQPGFTFTPHPSGAGGAFTFRPQPGQNPMNFIQNVLGGLQGAAPGAPGQAGVRPPFPNILQAMFRPPAAGAPPQPAPPAPGTAAPVAPGAPHPAAQVPHPAAPSAASGPRPAGSGPAPSLAPAPLINQSNLIRSNDMINFAMQSRDFSLPLAPLSNPTDVAQMSRFLLLLNFTLSRFSPLTQRTAELLSREPTLTLPNDRRETQRLTNSLGIILEELGVQLICASHLFQNLSMGAAPGTTQVPRDVRNCFRHMLEHQGPQNYMRLKQALIERINRMNLAPAHPPPPPAQPAAPVREQSKVQQPEDIFDDNKMDVERPVAAPRLAPEEAGRVNLENVVAEGGNVIEAMRDRLQNTPQGQVFQGMMGGMMPLVSQIMNNAGGARSIADIARNIQQSHGVVDQTKQEDKDVMTRIMECIDINDLFGVVSGNLGQMMHMQPKLQKIIKTEIQKSRVVDGATSKTEQPDSPANRKYLARRFAAYIEQSLQVPHSLRSNLKRGFDPVVASSSIIEESGFKLISFIMDFNPQAHGELAQAEFSEQLKAVLKEMVGRLVEGLKGGFTGGTNDVIAVIRHNLSKKFEEETGEGEGGMMSNMITNMMMNYVTAGYQRYMAEQTAQGVEQMQGGGEEAKGASEYSEIEHILLQEWKEQIDQDQEIQKQMPKQRPLSRVYRQLDSMVQLGKGMKTDLMEFGVMPSITSHGSENRLNIAQDDILERRIRSTLEAEGYPAASIQKSFVERPVPVMLSKRYNALLVSELRERLRSDPDYEPGRWTHLDALLKEAGP